MKEMSLSIIQAIRNLRIDDPSLARFLNDAREYAELYLIAKQRQKGCDGMGEVAMLKDELIYLTNEMIRHYKEKGYLSDDAFRVDIDLFAHDICRS
jgi:hypothetical protein